MKIDVDRTNYTGLGICGSVAPDAFQVNDDGDLPLLTETICDDRVTEIEQAVDRCPTGTRRLVR